MVFREGARARRPRPGHHFPGRGAAVGIGGPARQHPRHHRRPRTGPAWPAALAEGLSLPRRLRVRGRRRRSARPGEKAPRRRPRYRHEMPQHAAPRPPLPGRTRLRPAEGTLARPPARHPQPDPDRRHRESRTRPHANRAQDDHLKVAGKTSLEREELAAAVAAHRRARPATPLRRLAGAACSRDGPFDPGGHPTTTTVAGHRRGPRLTTANTISPINRALHTSEEQPANPWTPPDPLQNLQVFTIVRP